VKMNATRKVVMLPGPVEYDKYILTEVAKPSYSPFSSEFIECYKTTLQMLRKLIQTKDGQPIVVAGTGTLGWDMIASNIIESGDNVLVLNTGFFGQKFGECCQAYGAIVTHVHAKQFGDTIDTRDLKLALLANNYKLVCLTQVESSIGICNPVQTFTSVIKELQPKAFVAVDGVCSIGGEPFYFDEWGVDALVTVSQKALGVPPGLAICAFSQRLLSYLSNDRVSPVPSYYLSILSWNNVAKAYESGSSSYFATFPISLIFALHASLSRILRIGVEQVWKLHKIKAEAFRAACMSIGLTFVSRQHEYLANTVSAIFIPNGLDRILAQFSKHGIAVGGSLYSQYKYFRVGHMGATVLDVEDCIHHLTETIDALEKIVQENSKCLETGTAKNAYLSSLKNHE